MHVIRVFLLAQTACHEPDFASRLIDVQHLTHRPCTFRDLVFHGAFLRVVEVEMAPAVAFAHPDEFVRVVQPVPPRLLGVVDEGLRGLLDHHAHRARFRIHGEHAIKLMASLVVVEVKLAAAR